MSSESEVPLPPSGHFVDAVRTSARAAREAYGIKISPESIKRLVLSPAFTSSYARLGTQHGFAFPFAFPSPLSELNFLSVLSLLNFASGYRVPLHRLTGRGAYDTIRAFLFSLYLDSSNGSDGSGGGGGADWLSAQGMASISEATVAELMRLPVHEERPHPSLPGVTVGERGGPGLAVVRLVTGALNSTGAVLVQGGYPNLGAFVLEALKEGERAAASAANSETDPDLAALNVIVERLVRAFPALQDVALVRGQPVYCFKKAMILVHGLHIRFASRPGGADGSSLPPFPLPNTEKLPIFSDNVIPSMLVHLGVLDLRGTELERHFPAPEDEGVLDSLLREAPKAEAVPEATSGKAAQSNPAQKKVPDEGPVLTVEEAFALRAAAIDACELIVQYTRESPELAESLEPGTEWLRSINLPELDGWLWAVAKDRKDYRALKRFVLQDTVFF